MMSSYITNWGIDTLQNTKKYCVDTLIKEESLAEPLHSFIDAQTDFAKSVVKAGESFTESLNNSIQSLVKGVSK